MPRPTGRWSGEMPHAAGETGLATMNSRVSSFRHAPVCTGMGSLRVAHLRLEIAHSPIRFPEQRTMTPQDGVPGRKEGGGVGNEEPGSFEGAFEG